MLCLCWRFSGGGSARPSGGSGAFDGVSRDTMGTDVSATATLGRAQNHTFYFVFLFLFSLEFDVCNKASKTNEFLTQFMYGHSRDKLVTV